MILGVDVLAVDFFAVAALVDCFVVAAVAFASAALDVDSAVITLTAPGVALAVHCQMPPLSAQAMLSLAALYAVA